MSEDKRDDLDSAERPQEGSPKKGFWAGLNKKVRDAGDLAKSGAKSALDAISMLSPVPSDKVNTYKDKVTELLKELGVDFDGDFTEDSDGNFGGNFDIGGNKYYILINKGGSGIALFRNHTPLTDNGNFVTAEKGSFLGFSKVKNALKKDKIVSEQNARISEMLGKLGIRDSGRLVEYRDGVTREFGIFSNRYLFIIDAKGKGISLAHLIVEGDKKNMAYLQQDGTLSKSKVYLDDLTIETDLQKEINNAERLKEEYKNEFGIVLNRITNIGHIFEVEINLKGNPEQYFYIGNERYSISKNINGEGMAIIKRGDTSLVLQEDGTFIESHGYLYLDVSIVINALIEEDRRVSEEDRRVSEEDRRVSEEDRIAKPVHDNKTGGGNQLEEFMIALRNQIGGDNNSTGTGDELAGGDGNNVVGGDNSIVGTGDRNTIGDEDIPAFLRGNGGIEDTIITGDDLAGGDKEGVIGGNGSIAVTGDDTIITGDDLAGGDKEGVTGGNDSIVVTGDDTIITGDDLAGGDGEKTATQENGISDELASLVKILGISKEQGENIKELDKLEGDKRKIAMSLLNKNISPSEVLNIMSLVNTIPESFLGALAKTLEEITEDSIVPNLNLESAKKGDNFEHGDFVYRKVNSGWQQLPKGTLLAGVSHFEGNIISSNEITGNLNMTFIKTYIENFVKSMVTSIDEFKKFKKGDNFEFGEFVYRKVNSGWQQLPKGTSLALVNHFEGNIISDDEVLFNFVLYKDSNKTTPKATEEELAKTEEVVVKQAEAEVTAVIDEITSDIVSLIPESKKIPLKEDIINAEKGYNFEFKDFVYRRVYNGWQQLPKGTSLAKTSILAGKVLNNEELLKIVFENNSEKINSKSGLREKILEAKVGDSFEFGDFVYRKGGKVWQQLPKGTLLATTSISDGKIITNDELLAITKSFKSGEVLYVNGESIIYVGK